MKTLKLNDYQLFLLVEAAKTSLPETLEPNDPRRMLPSIIKLVEKHINNTSIEKQIEIV